MNTPSSEYFDKKARELFSTLITRYGYQLTQVSLELFNVFHIYTNPVIERKIEISNSIYGSDYGFSFFIYKLGTSKYNILYSVPQEHQDPECQFLAVAFDKLLSTQQTEEVIAGKAWRDLGSVTFQKSEPLFRNHH
jgi:hypothetical protein